MIFKSIQKEKKEEKKKEKKKKKKKKKAIIMNKNKREPSSSSPPESAIVKILSSCLSTFAGGSPSFSKKNERGWNFGSYKYCFDIRGEREIDLKKKKEITISSL